jgi:hypothetical protein
MLLREIACSRSGDKGNIVNVCVMPYDAADWELLREKLTAERVAEQFSGLADGKIERYELPGIRVLNFVIQDTLDGGVAASLRLDGHGKSYQSLILETEI